MIEVSLYTADEIKVLLTWKEVFRQKEKNYCILLLNMSQHVNIKSSYLTFYMC
jgi:hypothetical protein